MLLKLLRAPCRVRTAASALAVCFLLAAAGCQPSTAIYVRNEFSEPVRVLDPDRQIAATGVSSDHTDDIAAVLPQRQERMDVPLRTNDHYVLFLKADGTLRTAAKISDEVRGAARGGAVFIQVGPNGTQIRAGSDPLLRQQRAALAEGLLQTLGFGSFTLYWIGRVWRHRRKVRFKRQAL